MAAPPDFLWAAGGLMLSILLLHVPTSSAQVGTIEQDLTTMAAFPLQKRCAQYCFIYDGISCPDDVLGSVLGCASYAGCRAGQIATNDCYCRQDLQGPAQAYLTSCIHSRCSVGDAKIDASSAGSIYAQYCKDKGYQAPTVPATIIATKTGGGEGGLLGATTGGVGSGPTVSPSPSDANASTRSNKLPITTIIGIVIGGLGGLFCLLVGIKLVYSFCVRRRPTPTPAVFPPQPPPSYRPPIYPKPVPEYQHAPPPPESELGPDDSMSMVSGNVPRPLPSLLSAGNGYQQYQQYPHYGR